MARNKQDLFYSGKYYHMYNKVITERKLFIKDEDYIDFMKRYAKYFSEYFETYAYCLIPNHFHFLIKVKEEDEIKKIILSENTKTARKFFEGNIDLNNFLESQIRRWLSGFAIKHNNKYNRTGPLFKQGTKRVLLNAYRTFEQQMHYIHLNPAHHNLVKNTEKWPFSSYRTYLSDQETLLPREEVFERFGGKEKFIEFHQNPFDGAYYFD